MSSRHLMLAILVTAAFAVGGCIGSAPTPSAQLATIKIIPDVSIIKVGTVTQFSYVATRIEGVPPTGPPPAWSTTDSSVARVDPAGRVTAVRAGTTTLTIMFLGQIDARVLQVVP